MAGKDEFHLIADKWGRVKNIDICSVAEPTTTWPYMLWVDPVNQLIKVRNADDTAWISLGGAGTHDLMSATHPDSVADVVARGDLITGLWDVGSGEIKWKVLPKGVARDTLQMDGGGVEVGWVSITDGQDINKPVNTDGNAAIRPNRLGVGAAAPDQDGVIALAETSDPTPAANEGRIYPKDDGAGNTELYYMDESGNIEKMTPVSGAPIGAQYLVMALDAILTAERVLVGGDGLDLTDGGAGGNATLDVDATVGRVESGVTKTVGSGKDYATIQDAIDYFVGKFALSGCKIVVDAGTYSESLDLSDLFVHTRASLEIEGDTRVLAGMSYVHGAPGNRANLTNGGNQDGAVTLSRGGVGNVDLTVVVAGGNPDFDADGWVGGDKVMIVHDDKTATTYTVDSVLNNVITMTGAIGAIGAATCHPSATLLPNRCVSGGANDACVIAGALLTIDGFWFTSAGGQGMQVTNGSNVELIRCALADCSGRGLDCSNHSNLDASGGAVSVVATAGTSFVNMVTGTFMYAVVSKASNCFEISNKAYMNLYATNVNCAVGRGVDTSYMSTVNGQGMAATWCGTGYRALTNSYANHNSTNANNADNTVNYSPAVSDTEGNVFAIITWS